MALDLEALISDPPRLHGASADGTPLSWALGSRALRILGDTVQPGWHTLETGAGATTVLFAVQQTHHVCVVPSPEEILRIKTFCAEHGVPTDRITFIDQPSEAALPQHDSPPLDLVLLDGSHSFPSVFIDWYYATRFLKQGGWLFVDDIHLWTGRVLRDFLCAEDDWALMAEIPYRTAVFQKQAPIEGVRNWIYQPYVVSGSSLTVRQRAVAMVRRGEWGALRAEFREQLTRLYHRARGRVGRLVR